MSGNSETERNKKGGTMAEYAAMAFLIIIVVVGVYMLLGFSISELIRAVVEVF